MICAGTVYVALTRPSRTITVFDTCCTAASVFDAATARQKAAEAEQLAADVAEFRKAGGKVQVLGTTGIDKKRISRRQVVEGGAERRKAAKAGKP